MSGVVDLNRLIYALRSMVGAKGGIKVNTTGTNEETAANRVEAHHFGVDFVAESIIVDSFAKFPSGKDNEGERNYLQAADQ